jgi:hypothetical protein
MRTATVKLPEPLTPEPRVSENLMLMGYEEADIPTVMRHEAMWKTFPQSEEVGKAIVALCNEKLKKPLTFTGWHEGNVRARDDQYREHLIIGGWKGTFSSGVYFARGVVRRRDQFGRTFRFLINGQASKGSVQVAYWGEEDPFSFPDVQRFYEEYNRVKDAAILRRAQQPKPRAALDAYGNVHGGDLNPWR